jgi:hypothetical protein
MTRVIADATLPNRVRTVTDALEICDESGRILGYFHPAVRVTSPFSREELERRRQDRTGKPLSEVLRDIGAG